MSITEENRHRMINEIVLVDLDINCSYDYLKDILPDGVKGYYNYSDSELLDMYEQLDSHNEKLVQECRAQIVIEEVLTADECKRGCCNYNRSE